MLTYIYIKYNAILKINVPSILSMINSRYDNGKSL